MDYEEFLKLIILHWKEACDLNWKAQTRNVHAKLKISQVRDVHATLKISQVINFRTSKSSIFDAISKSGIGKKECFNFINEAVIKGDIVPAHGHYRLSEANVEKMLHEYAKNEPIDIESLKRRTTLRKPRTELNDLIYATPVEELKKMISKISPTKTNETDLQKIKIDNLRSLYIGFVKLYDLFAENNYLDNVEEFDINELLNPIIRYKDGTSKVISLPILLAQYEKAYAVKNTEKTEILEQAN